MKAFASLAAAALLAACGSSPKPEPAAETPAPSVETEAAKIERGQYLVGIMGCNDCHSPKLMGPQGPYLDPDRILSGYPAERPLPPLPTNADGWALMAMDLTAAVGPWGTTFAANITSDATGIGNWSYEQFERSLRHGLYKGLEGSRPLLPPMPWQNLASMKPEDMQAVFAYLKSTKPVENVVPAPLPPGGKAS
jgi:hypothetical protein